MSLEYCAKRVRKARRDLEWSQRELAEKAGVSLPTVARFEVGGDIHVSTYLALLRALNLEVRFTDESGRVD